MLKIKRTNCIVAVYNDDHVLLDALRSARAKGYNILDVFTPFPVHGIERALGIKRSNLGIAAFVFGCIGLSFGLAMTYYTMTYDWRINIGGKPNWPLLSFVPVLFECTVLITALGMVSTFLTICKLAPGVIPVIYDPRATDDRFVVLIEDDARGTEIRSMLQSSGAEEIRNDVHIEDNFPGPSPLKLR